MIQQRLFDMSTRLTLLPGEGKRDTRRPKDRVKVVLVSLTMFTVLFLITMDPVLNQGSHHERFLSQVNQVCGQSSDLNFVGFWHIGKSNKDSKISRDEFVLEQLDEIQSTHLFNDCNEYNVTLNYVTTINLSNETKNILSKNERIHELPPSHIENMQEDEEYFEFTTLMELHSYCINLPEDEDAVVFYIHSKSHNQWRYWMENYVLGESCVECMEDPSKMACGPSLITDPSIWQHFSGNFYMTRCQHVRTLDMPWKPTIMDEIHDIMNLSKNTSSGFPHSYAPYGRYFAEYWLMNHNREIEHDHPASDWPNLRNLQPEYHEPLISKNDICTRHPPKFVSDVSENGRKLRRWDTSSWLTWDSVYL